MDIKYIKDKLLEELWDNGKSQKIDFKTITNKTRSGSDYHSLKKQIDNYINNIQNSHFVGKICLLPSNHLTDDEWVSIGIAFMNREDSLRKIVNNITRGKISETGKAVKKSNECNFPSLDELKEKAKNPEEFVSLINTHFIDVLNKIYYENEIQNRNDIFCYIHQCKKVFSDLCKDLITNYEKIGNNYINYEVPENLTTLIISGLKILSLVLLKAINKIKLSSNTTPFLALSELYKNLIFYFGYKSIEINHLNEEIWGKSPSDKLEFLIGSFILYYPEYLFCKELAESQHIINKILLDENSNNPQIFYIKYPNTPFWVSKMIGDDFYTEGSQINDIDYLLKKANTFVRKHWKDDNVGFLRLKVVFRELFVINTTYRKKSVHNVKIVNKVLRSEELDTEQIIFLDCKLNRGFIREFDSLDAFPIYINILHGAFDCFSNAFKMLNYKLSITEIYEIFSRIMDYTLKLCDEYL